MLGLLLAFSKSWLSSKVLYSYSYCSNCFRALAQIVSLTKILFPFRSAKGSQRSAANSTELFCHFNQSVRSRSLPMLLQVTQLCDPFEQKVLRKCGMR